jgi:FHA domain-containing protein
MITIRVTAIQGKTVAVGPSFDFDETGGAIGRAETNQLVLEDTDRVISRVHARVVFRNGQYELLDQGANPIILNGTRLGNGVSCMLKPGDHFEIGPYRLEVLASAAAPAGDAMSVTDPLGLMQGLGPEGHDPFQDIAVQSWPRPGGKDKPAAPEKPSPPQASHADPLGLFSGLDATPRPTSAPSGGAAGAPAEGGLIPEDFDPFADPFPTPSQLAKARGASPEDALGLGPLGESKDASLDSLFGLDEGGVKPSTDLFSGSPLGESVERAGELPKDPLQALGFGEKAAAERAAAPDDLPAEHHAFQPPPVPPEASSPAAAAARTPKTASGEAFFSWEEGEDEKGVARTMILSPANGHKPAPQAPGPEPILPPEAVGGGDPFEAEAQVSDGFREVEYQPGDEPTWWATAVTRPPSAGEMIAPDDREDDAAVPPPAGPGHGSHAAGDPQAVLLAALLKGLGLPELQLPGGLTPQLMERIGVLLRESTQGALDLLLARAMTKREVRADVTMIFSKGNNPLKFSPDVSAALAHLLNPQGRGFLGPEEAMREAFGDLRAHQLGFVAGMRAAVEGLLQRFGPEALEQRLTQKSMLDSLLPINRRAKLWDLYQQLYRDIAEEAEEDFHAVLGREFVRAYEEQVAKLASEKKRS